VKDEPETEPDEKWIELRVRVPADSSWEEIRQIEDEIAEESGKILKKHGLKRKSHKRTVTSDYSEYQDS